MKILKAIGLLFMVIGGLFWYITDSLTFEPFLFFVGAVFELAAFIWMHLYPPDEPQNLNRLKDTIQKLGRILPFQGKDFAKKIILPERLPFLRNIETTIKDELRNPYLDGKVDILKKWNEIDGSNATIIQLLEMTEVQNVFDENTNSHLTDSDQASMLNSIYESYIDKLYDFYSEMNKVFWE